MDDLRSDPAVGISLQQPSSILLSLSLSLSLSLCLSGRFYYQSRKLFLSMTAHCDVSRPFDGYRPPSSLLPASRLRSDENFIARPYLSLSLSLSLSFFFQTRSLFFIRYTYPRTGSFASRLDQIATSLARSIIDRFEHPPIRSLIAN